MSALSAAARRVVITVDGPGGAGKGMVCRQVALRFGLAYLETGAIYRALARFVLDRGERAPQVIALLAEQLPFEFGPDAAGEFRAWLAGVEVTAALRSEEVGRKASELAVQPAVRAALLTFQRNYGGNRNVIMDGRDTGTVVWPEADLKIFLEASLEERAKRRAFELQGQGKNVTLQEVKNGLAERDAQDRNRACAPLAPAPDAVIIDTTTLSPSESVLAVSRLVERLLNNQSYINP